MNRKLKGKTNYLDGLAAEEIACRHYIQAGYILADKRWRGRSGEIDLVFRSREAVICVEVKKANSFAVAAQKLSKKQLGRIGVAATEYVANEPMGQLTPLRVDLALVNSQGECSVVENISVS